MQAKHPAHIKHKENKEFKKSLGYIARACLKTNKQTYEEPGSGSVYMAVHKRTQEARVSILLCISMLLVTSGISAG